MGVKVKADYPLALGDAKINLMAAIRGEKEEWSEFYPDSVKITESEGVA